MRGSLWLLLLVSLACTASPGAGTSTGEADTTASSNGGVAPTTGGATGATSGGDTSSGEPLPDGLRVHQLQAMGTHNSYHVSSGASVIELDYTHKPLAEQLDNGARQFELDINFKTPDDPIEVYHLELLDPGTTCMLLTECLQALRGWSALMLATTNCTRACAPMTVYAGSKASMPGLPSWTACARPMTARCLI